MCRGVGLVSDASCVLVVSSASETGVARAATAAPAVAAGGAALGGTLRAAAGHRPPSLSDRVAAVVQVVVAGLHGEQRLQVLCTYIDYDSINNEQDYTKNSQQLTRRFSPLSLLMQIISLFHLCFKISKTRINYNIILSSTYQEVGLLVGERARVLLQLLLALAQLLRQMVLLGQLVLYHGIYDFFMFRANKKNVK